MSLGLYDWSMLASVWERSDWDIGEVPGAKEMLHKVLQKAYNLQKPNHQSCFFVEGFLLMYLILVLNVAYI